MITYKSGDLWKVIVLVVLIAATFFISFRFILTSVGRPPARPRAAATTPAAGAKVPGTEVFAQRAQPPSELLNRARTAPDPFQPYVTSANAVPEETLPPPAAAPTTPKAAGPLPPLRAPRAEEWRLVGVVTGTYPLAVISAGETRYFVRAGESLPTGWRVARLDRDAVTLTREGAQVVLKISDEEPPALRQE